MDKFEPKKIKEASEFLDKILKKQQKMEIKTSIWKKMYKKFFS